MPQSSVEKEFQEMFDSIKDYPFDELDSKLQRLNPRFYGKKWLDPKEFDENGINSEVLDQVKKSLADNKVVVLVGNIRSGTTSVMQSWISEKKDDRVLIRASTPGFEKFYDIKNIATEGIFLDEMEALPERMQLVEDLQGSHDLVIRPHLVGIEFYREELQKRGIEFEEVKILPLNTDQMNGYLAQKLSLKTDDKFVNFITKLAGGSIFLANNLTDHFVDDLNLQGIRQTLEEEMVDPYIRDIHNKRLKIPKDLVECLPTPFIEKLMYKGQ